MKTKNCCTSGMVLIAVVALALVTTLPALAQKHCDIGAYVAMPDFFFSPIATIIANVGGSGSASVQVNSFVEFSSAVTLTDSEVPTGFSTSFGTNPETPASDGSASSTLTVNIVIKPNPIMGNVVNSGGSGIAGATVNIAV